MKHLTFLSVLLLFPVSLLAGEPHWQQFLKEETVLIVHVDLDKVDVAQTLQNNKTLVENILQAFPAAPKDVQTLIPLAESGKKYLTQTLGIHEAYLVVNIQMIGMAAVILPQTGSIKTETLRAAATLLLPKDSLKIVNSRDNKFVLIVPTVLEPDQWIDQIIPSASAARPDFVEAFKAVEDAPVKIVAALPEFVRKVVKETAPKLPEPFDKIDIVTSLSGLRWKAVGIEPETGTVSFTAAMTSELAAFNAQETWQKTLPVIIDNVPTSFSISSIASVEKMEIKESIVKNKERIQVLLTLKADGKNLALRWEKPQFEELLTIAAPLIEEMALSEAERMRRQSCSLKIKQLVLAFHNHHDSLNRIPPPFTADANGKPLHSWRVLVLPFLDQDKLYKQIRLNEPWDSAHNRQFHDKMPPIFQCPMSTLGNPNRDTAYCMVVGNDMIGVPDGKGISYYKITDGTSNTILLVERKTPVCWMEPTDVLQEHAYLGVNKHEQGIGSEHEGGVMVGFADGSQCLMKETIDLKILKAVLTRAGGESYEWNKYFVR